MPTLTDAEKLKWKLRTLEVMRAIDRIRDNMVDERQMMANIITTLADAVEAELCLLCLRDDDAPQGSEQELQLRSVLDRMAVYDATTENYFRDIAQRATELAGADSLQADFTLKNRRHSYCLAAPLRVGKD